MKILSKNTGATGIAYNQAEIDGSDPRDLRILTEDIIGYHTFALDQDLAVRLLAHLKEKGLAIRIVHAYDAASAWSGFHFYLDGFDLSINGFCFKPGNVIRYLSGRAPEEWKGTPPAIPTDPGEHRTRIPAPDDQPEPDPEKPKRPDPKNYFPTDLLRGKHIRDLEKYIDFLEEELKSK